MFSQRAFPLHSAATPEFTAKRSPVLQKASDAGTNAAVTPKMFPKRIQQKDTIHANIRATSGQSSIATSLCAATGPMHISTLVAPHMRVSIHADQAVAFLGIQHGSLTWT